MAGGRVRRVREVAGIAYKRILSARKWALLPKAQRLYLEDLRRFMGVPAESLRVRFSAKTPQQAMAEMHKAIAKMPPNVFAQRMANWARSAGDARLNPERTVNFFLQVRDSLQAQGAQQQLQTLQAIHQNWAQGQKARQKSFALARNKAA
ncbi:MAG: hypothetical protein CL943_03695 [Candidatus Diapherotrites archaeon]|uniref:Uncharacterized protein n=1 Tax=Candidatus Iainarchaeum sp. TaxID=3101447 RepID=A0A2D6M1V2_9ARCH|nr:hypothetical protein [Candidatus Diapherotrites archaeon]|tara:strand:- start:5050 stop:5499 length:450 start_codon:yes stop_codon:yes gene_type:complete